MRELSNVFVALLFGAAGCADDAPHELDSPSPVMEGRAANETPANRSPSGVQAAEAGNASATPKPANDKPAGAADPASPSVTDPQAKQGTASPASDDCSARVVSRKKPCSDDPDPCKLNSGWDGDEYCLLPPAPDEGIQIHFGPTSYSDKDATDMYKIEPHSLLNESLLAHVPLADDRFVGRITVHMRPGMDHWISTRGPADAVERVYPDMGCGEGTSFDGNALGGGQNLIYDDPPLGIPAPENADIVRRFPGKASACLDLYSINRSDKPQLREAWVNVYFADEPKEVIKLGGISVVSGLGLNLPPGQNKIQTYEGTFDGDGRIIQLLGHRMQWTPRLAVWLNDALIYDSWDWEAAVTFNYDSITTNPPIDPAGHKDGAVSRIVPFKAGDRLKFSCFVENTSTKPLTFASDLESGELCTLWGSTVGAGLSGMSQ